VKSIIGTTKYDVSNYNEPAMVALIHQGGRWNNRVPLLWH